MSTTMLVPRLKLSDRAVVQLRRLAETHGVGVGVVIAAIIEARLANEPRSENEVVFRLILAGERYGLGVGGASAYPLDWITVGGLSHDECGELSASYIAWRRKNNEQARDSREASRGP